MPICLGREGDKARKDWRGEGGTWSIFAWYVPLASQSPYPVIVDFVANYKPFSHCISIIIELFNNYSPKAM